MPFQFKNEAAFREWICIELREKLPDGWYVVAGKNVADILVSWQDRVHPILIFLEVKYHKKGHGRFPIGNKKGEGYQMEYLLNNLAYLEKYLRWIVGDEVTDSALLLTNEEVREYAANGLSLGKHNNFHNSLFKRLGERQVPMAQVPERLVQMFQSMIDAR